MILDKLLMFFKKETVSDGKASAALDFGAGGDAVGQELNLEIRAVETFAAGASDTVQFKLQTSGDKFASETEDVVLSPAIKVNGVKAGKTLFKVRVPQGMKRYARIACVVSGAVSAGKVTAFMSKEL